MGRFTFPLCWRCSGLLVGSVVGSLVIPCMHLPAATLMLVVLGCLAALPAAVDVLCQVVSSYRSNRSRRLVTGLLLGAGIALLCHSFVSWFRSSI
jgi:uncharacterized membrane protein